MNPLSGLGWWEEVADTGPTLPVREKAFLTKDWSEDGQLKIWEKKRSYPPFTAISCAVSSSLRKASGANIVDTVSYSWSACGSS